MNGRENVKWIFTADNREISVESDNIYDAEKKAMSKGREGGIFLILDFKEWERIKPEELDLF